MLLRRVFREARRAVARIAASHRADDVFQDAMLILLLRLRSGGLRDPDAARQFVCGVARRLEANLRRKEQRRRNVPLPDDVPLPDPTPPALAQLLVRERHRTILGALAAMPSVRDRLILYRLYVLDHDRNAIRHDLGLSTSAFDLVLCRARARLRRVLVLHVKGPAGSRQ